ncbi:GntR family transcriptional regulator [Rhodococcus koreensis]
MQSLRLRLSQESWSAGDRLPSEPALAKELGVGRVSVRAALAQLESEGLVDRRHGSGTYVNSVRPLVRSLHLNVGSDELIRPADTFPASRKCRGSRKPPPKRSPNASPSTSPHRRPPVPGTDRRRHTRHDLARLFRRGPGSRRAATEHGPSLYTFLSTLCGVEVKFGVADLEPALVGEEQASVFGVDAGELCLPIKQIDYDLDERPVSHSVEYHLASAFDFQLVRQGLATLPRLASVR